VVRGGGGDAVGVDSSFIFLENSGVEDKVVKTNKTNGSCCVMKAQKAQIKIKINSQANDTLLNNFIFLILSLIYIYSFELASARTVSKLCHPPSVERF